MIDTSCLVITTYNREEKFEALTNSIDTNKFLEIYIFKDGDNSYPPQHQRAYNKSLLDNLKNKKNVRFFQQPSNVGVGVNKHLGIKKALKAGAKHIFVVEDDIVVKDNCVWERCRWFSEKTELSHFNWNNAVSERVRYETKINNIPVLVNIDPEGTFQYFKSDVFNHVAMDIKYHNALEHVDLEYQMVLSGIIPPFWYFVSPLFLGDYLHYDGKDASVRTVDERLTRAFEHFKNKWDINVRDIPDTPNARNIIENWKKQKL